METRTISVLVPYRDAAATLRQAVAGALADMTSGDELVLVDDGSTDDGPTIARGFARSDRRVVCASAGGVGVAGALVHGLALCRGAWIARMDADDITLPGRFAAQVAGLERDPTLAAIATRIDLFGAPGPGIHRFAAWQNGLLTAEDHARAIFVESPVCHPSTMLRRAALDAVGGYRTGDFAEDYELWLRLLDAGWALAKLPDVFLRWRIDPRSVTFTDPRLSKPAMRRLRARYLARRIDRPFAIWGAGPTGRRLARELETHRLTPRFFLDIDPLKIGRTARGAEILAVEDGVARAQADGIFLVIAVAADGAREVVRARLSRTPLVEGEDFLCAA